jgi:hypothetical protein
LRVPVKHGSFRVGARRSLLRIVKRSGFDKKGQMLNRYSAAGNFTRS